MGRIGTVGSGSSQDAVFIEGLGKQVPDLPQESK